jgi:hypothetical protein
VSDWDDEPRFAGSLTQYAGQELTFALGDGTYDLRFGNDLVGQLTRPNHSMAAETREGHWELRHSRRSVARIEAVEPVSGQAVLRYRRRLLLPGGSIAGQGASERYLFRHQGARWKLSGVDHLLELRRGRNGYEHVLKVEQAALLPAELGLLALLCCYVTLLAEASSREASAAGWTAPPPGP